MINNINNILLIIVSFSLIVLIFLTLLNTYRIEKMRNRYSSYVPSGVDEETKELAEQLQFLSLNLLYDKYEIVELELGESVHGLNGEEFHPDSLHENHRRIVLEYKLKG